MMPGINRSRGVATGCIPMAVAGSFIAISTKGVRAQPPPLSETERIRQAVAKLESHEPAARKSGAKALADLARGARDRAALKRAIPALVARLKDESASVRSAAAGALWSVGARLGDQQAVRPIVPSLIRALREIASRVKSEAALAPVVGPLRQALGDDDAKVRKFANDALQRIHNP